MNGESIGEYLVETEAFQQNQVEAIEDVGLIGDVEIAGGVAMVESGEVVRIVGVAEDVERSSSPVGPLTKKQSLN